MMLRESHPPHRFEWRRTLRVLGPLFALASLLSISCGQDETTIVLGKGEPEAGAPGGFDPGADSGARKDSGAAAMCPSAECPAGRGTCPGSQFPCDIDFRWNNENCGACGISCGQYEGLHLEATCVDGKCVLQCRSEWGGDSADCNGLVEDGCEIDRANDKNNCGKCGNACGSDEVCVGGTCICKISESCGKCGNVCPPPPDPMPYPPEWHMIYGCSGGECNKLICGSPWTDCNKDVPNPSGDGCEIDIENDRQNCGSCGKACQPGEECWGGECHCSCGALCFTRLETDTYNCGVCNNNCHNAITPNTDPICNQGVCEYPCAAGWEDCDRIRDNGCETNVLNDPENCGSCGLRCDGIDGQGCVEGRCTVEECTVK